jgi:hypothetical protein
MRTSSLILIVLAVLLVVSLTAIWFYPSAQDFMTSNKMWNGVNSFVTEYGATVVESEASLEQSPSESVIITIPYLEYSPNELAGIKHDLANGSQIVIMDDFGFGNQLLQYLELELRFFNYELLDPLFCYKTPYIPRITDFSPDIQNAGIQAIALNHATALDTTTGWTVLAWSSQNSFLDINSNGTQDKAEPSGPFPVAAGRNYDAGYLVVIADPSLIINTMVTQNDNRAFINYIIHSHYDNPGVMMDVSHLSTSPLDQSKVTLADVRQWLNNPYILVILTAIIFVIFTVYMLKKGELIGKY